MKSRAGITMAMAVCALALTPSNPAEAACKRAKVQGVTKCLKTGQFCKPAAQRDYRRAGFKCVRGAGGRYRLRYA